MDKAALKNQVREFWNQNPCGTSTVSTSENSREYYDQIEEFRYKNEPQIFSFAQFTRYHGKKILEVGVGMGTDFLQWVRAGAEATGLDLTDSGIIHVKNRLGLYGLKAKELTVGDAEALPYPEGSFDLVYSWGVIMHTPDTMKALSEIIRVVKPGGDVKLMVYNRFSLNTFYVWFKNAFLKGRPWRSLSWCLFHFQESQGTKAFTVREIKRALLIHPVHELRIQTHLTYADTLENSRKTLVRWFGFVVSRVMGFSCFGWFMTIQFKKNAA